MSRALQKPQHLALRQHLKRQGLLPSTRAKYEEIMVLGALVLSARLVTR